MKFLGHFSGEYIKIGQYTLWLLILSAALFGQRFLKTRISFKLNPRTAFLLICALGLLLRMGWLGYSTHEPKFAWRAQGELIENDIVNIQAAELSEGKWFLNEDGTPSARRPIGYPIALGALYKIFGAKAEVAWVFHLVLFLVTVWILYEMTALLFGPRLALASAFLFSINPISIYSVKLVTDEHLFLPLWYGGLLLLFYDIHKRNLKAGWLWYGLLFGLAAMTRTYAIMMPFIVGLAFWAKHKDLKKAVANCLLTLLVMQTINLPWVVRNYKAFGVPVIYAVASHSLYYSTNPSASPLGTMHPEKGTPGYSAEFEAARESGNEGLMQKYANQAIIRWIVSDPAAFIDLGLSKILYFMHWGKSKGVWPLWYQFQEGHYDPAHKVPQGVMKALEEYAFFFYFVTFHFFLFALVHIAFFGKRKISGDNLICIQVILACFACWLAMHMIIMPDPKYRFPLEPLMGVFAVYFASILVRKDKAPLCEHSASQ